MTDEDKPVLQWIPRENVYRVGAFEGCGCGFNGGEYDSLVWDDKQKGYESVAALGDYLQAYCPDGCAILYACWDGNQSMVRRKRLVSLSDITGPDFWFEEGDLIEISGQDQKAGMELNGRSLALTKTLSPQQRDRWLQACLAQARGQAQNGDLLRAGVARAVQTVALRNGIEVNASMGDPLIESLNAVTEALGIT